MADGILSVHLRQLANRQRRQIFAADTDGALGILQRYAARLPRLLQLLAQLLQHEMQYSRARWAAGLCGFWGVLPCRQYNPECITNGRRLDYRDACGERLGLHEHTRHHGALEAQFGRLAQACI